MTTTTLPRTFDHLTWHRGRRTGAPYPIGHAGPCPTVSDDGIHFDADDPAAPLTNDEPWPCATCFPLVGSGREVAFEAARPLGNGTDRVARAAAAVEADPRVAEAIAYAKAYAGTFDFLVAMREKAQKAHWTPTPNMVNAILKCKARDDERTAARSGAPVSGSTSTGTDRPPTEKQTAYLRSLLDERAGVAEAEDVRTILNDLRTRGELTASRISMAIDALKAIPVPRADSPTAARTNPEPLPEVEAGHYAVTTEAGHLAFYEVDRPTEGRWAGRTFLSVLASDERHPIRGEAARTILAKIAEDPEEAMAAYGREIGRCGRCHRTLTDETSRKYGIGPECRKILGGAA